MKKVYTMPRHEFSAFLFLCMFFAFSFAHVLNASELAAVKEDTALTSAFRYMPLAENSPKWWAGNTDAWKPRLNEQTCPASLDETASDDEKLTYKFQFLGPGGIEYFSFGTPVPKINAETYIGMKVRITGKDGFPMDLPFNLRFVDDSGECHQIPLNIPSNGWLIGKIQSSGGCWGGDGDKILQFPCRFESVTMDRRFDGYKAEGKLEVYDIRFFRKNEIEDMISVELVDSQVRKGTNVFYASPRDAAAASGKDASSVTFQLAPRPEFAGKSLSVEAEVRQNGSPSGESRVYSLAQAQKITMTRKLAPGFETFIFTPLLKDETGKTVKIGISYKFSFDVLPESEETPSAVNPWYGISTHCNIGCVDRVPQACVGMVRDDCLWAQTEREKGVYTFPKYLDEYITCASELGLEPLIIILYGNPLYDGGDFPHTDEAVAAYARYAAAVVKHFQGRCRHFEVWNEWNGACSMGNFAKNGHNTPENYVRLLAAAAPAMRDANPDIYIIGGGGDHYTGHLPQIRREMELGVMKYCDAYSVHPYIYPKTPEQEGMREKMLAVLKIMRENGCENPRLWLTELGWPTYRGLSRNPEISASSAAREEFSARMLVESSLEYQAIPEVERYFWYDLQNDGTDPEYNENNFGLLHNHTAGWLPKASYAALSVVTRLTNGAAVRESADFSADGVKIFEIQKKNAPKGTKILAVWTQGKTFETLALPETVRVKRVMGMYGNELPAETRTVTEQPLYFEIEFYTDSI